MRPMAIAVAVVLGTPALTAAARAQDAPLQLGTRIRMTVPCASAHQPSGVAGRGTCTFTGELLRWGADTIALAMEGAHTRLAYDLKRVHQLAVSRGYRSHWLLGAGIGFVAGAGGTFLLLHRGGSTSPCDRSANQDALRTEECLGLAGLGGLAGAGIGALIGGRVRTERWEAVPFKRLRISVVAQGRLLLGAVVEF